MTHRMIPTRLELSLWLSDPLGTVNSFSASQEMLTEKHSDFTFLPAQIIWGEPCNLKLCTETVCCIFQKPKTSALKCHILLEPCLQESVEFKCLRVLKRSVFLWAYMEVQWLLLLQGAEDREPFPTKYKIKLLRTQFVWGDSEWRTVPV